MRRSRQGAARNHSAASRADVKNSKEILYQRSPHLVFYWKNGALVVENYLSQTRTSAAPTVLPILEFFGGWRSADAFCRHMRGYSRPSLRRILADLVRHSLLQRSDRPRSHSEEKLKTWTEWGPSASFFHFSTKNGYYEFDPATLRRQSRERAAHYAIPKQVKRYRGVRQVPLPRPQLQAELPQVLLARRTWRRFSTAPVDLSDIATLLGLTFGVQSWVKEPILGRLPLKTSPSGGARHPLEAYVLARNVAGLQPGLYHYAADQHQLEFLRRGATPGQISRYLAGQKWFGAAAAVVFITAVFPRTQWKYQSPRAYRVVLAETGHFCQTFCLLATWLGLAPFCTMALADSLIEKDLELDGVTESVLYAAGVGSRPKGITEGALAGVTYPLFR